MSTRKSTTAVAKRQPNKTVKAGHGKSVLASMAARYNTDGQRLLNTLKNTAFKGATDEQLIALCIVADQYRLNPFTKEIYAFPDKKTGGIVPVVGVDGWLRIINEHPQMDGMDVHGDGESCTVTIFRKDRTHPTTATEYLDECRRDTAPWKSHPARMLRHKAIIQAARIAFGFSLKDPDEAERIIEAQEAEDRPEIAPPRVVDVGADCGPEVGSDEPDTAGRENEDEFPSDIEDQM